MSLSVRSLTGEQIVPLIEDLAALRMAVFAEWPYLYAGDRAYEEWYLREFAAAEGSVLVLAQDGGKPIGAATASPMPAQKDEFRRPFEQNGISTDDMFYFGESVLLPEYRGRGLGHAFFDHREAQAARWGARSTVFAAVIREPNHPARPAGYSPLDAFWTKRGYRPVPGSVMELAWQDHGERAESLKTLQCWMRRP